MGSIDRSVLKQESRTAAAIACRSWSWSKNRLWIHARSATVLYSAYLTSHCHAEVQQSCIFDITRHVVAGLLSLTWSKVLNCHLMAVLSYAGWQLSNGSYWPSFYKVFMIVLPGKNRLWRPSPICRRNHPTCFFACFSHKILWLLYSDFRTYIIIVGMFCSQTTIMSYILIIDWTEVILHSFG